MKFVNVQQVVKQFEVSSLALLGPYGLDVAARGMDMHQLITFPWAADWTGRRGSCAERCDEFLQQVVDMSMCAPTPLAPTRPWRVPAR
eukprot:7868369-Pyramimonas_sp.AAC.1